IQSLVSLNRYRVILAKNTAITFEKPKKGIGGTIAYIQGIGPFIYTRHLPFKEGPKPSHGLKERLSPLKLDRGGKHKDFQPHVQWNKDFNHHLNCMENQIYLRWLKCKTVIPQVPGTRFTRYTGNFGINGLCHSNQDYELYFLVTSNYQYLTLLRSVQEITRANF